MWGSRFAVMMGQPYIRIADDGLCTELYQTTKAKKGGHLLRQSSAKYRNNSNCQLAVLAY
jgi:hypothetical protein